MVIKDYPEWFNAFERDELDKIRKYVKESIPSARWLVIERNSRTVIVECDVDEFTSDIIDAITESDFNLPLGINKLKNDIEGNRYEL